MAIIQDLPFEILSEVFAQLQNEGSTSSREGLISCARVCKDWTSPAQKQLWLHFEFDLRREDKVGKFVHAGGKVKGVRTERVMLVDCRSNDEILRVISGCPAIKILELGPLMRSKRLNLGLLQYEGLSGKLLFRLSSIPVRDRRLSDIPRAELQELVLAGELAFRLTPPPTIRFPFKLSKFYYEFSEHEPPSPSLLPPSSSLPISTQSNFDSAFATCRGNMAPSPTSR